MRRILTILAAVVVLVAVLVWTRNRLDQPPPASTAPAAAAAAADAQPAVAASAGALVRVGIAPARSGGSPEGSEPDCVVRGFDRRQRVLMPSAWQAMVCAARTGTAARGRT